ncbi:uncharacterized protein LOC124421421 isoform X2 [Lucilia cuprina]|nr:uncharacterized protein LOC124421421 isoform X2 [Lucilia cuprina]
MLNFMSSEANSIEDDMLKEIQKYLNTSVSETESLEWWKEHQKVFPRVAILANILFGIPATLASSEVAFSMAGSCIVEKRPRLNPSTVKNNCLSMTILNWCHL